MLAYHLIFLTVMILTFFLYIDGVDYGQVDDILNLNDDDVVIIQSKNFPDRCCQPRNYQVNYIGSNDQHIRLEFTDIDIPLGSDIILLDTSDELLPDQPVIVDKTYIRKGFAFNGSSIKVIFKPINEGKLSQFYAGFRAEVRATPKLPSQWVYWPTSEGCGPVNDVMTGGILELHSRPSIYNNNVQLLPSMPLHDCIWVFKLPPEFKEASYETRLFIRIDEMIISDKLKSKFELTVRNDNSMGEELVTLTGSSRQITNTSKAKTVTANSNLHVRLKLPYISTDSTAEDTYVLRITYGIYSPTTSVTSECMFGPLSGFNCKSPSWCVPQTYKCNGVINCVNLDDELETTCAIPRPERTTPATTTTTTTTTTKPRYGDQGSTTCTRYYCLILEKCFHDWNTYVAECTAKKSQKLVASSGQSFTERPSTTTEKVYKVDTTKLGKCADHDAIYCDARHKCFHFDQYIEKCIAVVGKKCKSWEKECDDGTCISKYRQCKDKSCRSYEKKCSDGRCISSWENCDNLCKSYQKECANGKCVYSSSRCVEEACPSYKPFRCDGGKKCVYESYKCDDTCDCDDCSDEDTSVHCTETFASYSSSGFGGVIAFVIIILVVTTIIILACYIRSKTTSSGFTSIVVVMIIIVAIMVIVCACCIRCRNNVGAPSGIIFIAPLITLGVVVGFGACCWYRICRTQSSQNTGFRVLTVGSIAAAVILLLIIIIICRSCYKKEVLREAEGLPKNIVTGCVISAVFMVLLVIIVICRHYCKKQTIRENQDSGSDSVKYIAIAAAGVLLLIIIIVCRQCSKKDIATQHEESSSSSLGFLSLLVVGVVVAGIIYGVSKRNRNGSKKSVTWWVTCIIALFCAITGIVLVICRSLLMCPERSDANIPGANTLLYLLILVPTALLFATAVVFCKKGIDRGNTFQNTTTANTTTYSSGTAMHPVVTAGAPPPAPRSYIQYDLVPTNPSSAGGFQDGQLRPPQPTGPTHDPSAPPAYGEALDTTVYPPTQPAAAEEMPPPPSYESVATAPELPAKPSAPPDL